MSRGLLLLLAAACSQPTERRVERCRALGSDTLRAHGVEVHVGSTLDGASQLTAGRLARCEDSASATASFLVAVELVSALPAPLRPGHVVIHHRPALPAGARPLDALEAHRPSRSLLGTGDEIPRPVWLHELAHVRMFGERPAAPIARRILDAIDEGVADYYAAVVLGTPDLGARDLTSPPRIAADDWAALASNAFDPHRLGWALAASLWRAEPTSGPLLEDLVACMATSHADAANARTSETLSTWLGACSPRSSAQIIGVVCGWLPAELAATCR